MVLASSFAAGAHAGTFLFNFLGSGVSGTIDLTYSVNPNTGPIPGTDSPNTVDPVGSYIVSNISGTFSDTSLSISNAVISGIVPSNPALPEPTNFYAPSSFGFYPITNDLPGLSYDGLFYPGGSPQSSSDYTFHGGFFDIYGIMFTLDNGDTVNFWSNGEIGGNITYGVGVTNGTDLLHYAGLVGVPEPTSWALMLLGVAGIGGAMRGSRKRGQSATAA
jgi:hypothetical protein